MADVKISDLQQAATAAGAMQIEVNDAGSSKRVTINQIQDKIVGTSNGLIARTAENTVAARTITAGDGIIVSNGNGASGNPTVAVDFTFVAEVADLANLAAANLSNVTQADARSKVGTGTAAYRNHTQSVGGNPSGGSDGDTWSVF